MRDAVGYEMAVRNGQVTGDFEGWMQDPYDKNYTRGLRMNLSEAPEYDAVFPTHPLSILRGFLKDVIQYN